MKTTYDENTNDSKNLTEDYDPDRMNHDKTYTELPATPPWLPKEEKEL